MIELPLSLQKRLPYKRFQHSVFTMHAMAVAAKVYGLNIVQASMAGLGHDIAWAMPIDQMVETLNRCDPVLLSKISDAQLKNPTFLHGPAGACVALEAGINDEAIFLAIKEHSGCFPEMTLLSRCLRVVDLTLALPATDGPMRARIIKRFMMGDLYSAENLIAKHKIGRSSTPPKPSSQQPSVAPQA